MDWNNFILCEMIGRQLSFSTRQAQALLIAYHYGAVSQKTLLDLGIYRFHQEIASSRILKAPVDSGWLIPIGQIPRPNARAMELYGLNPERRSRFEEALETARATAQSAIKNLEEWQSLLQTQADPRA